VAFLIDCLILTIATGALWGRLITSFANRMAKYQSAYPNGNTASARAAFGRVFTQTTGPYVIVLCFTICVAVSYYWLLTGYWGTTFGKRCLGTWVVTARDRSKVSLRASFLRALIFVVGGEVIPLFFLIDNLWLLWDRRRQCLHDKVARTVVVTTAVSHRSSIGRRRRRGRRRRPARRFDRARPARRGLAGRTQATCAPQGTPGAARTAAPRLATGRRRPGQPLGRTDW
jgi:uncharacterized RDD family membrane protein YckC